MKIFTISLGCPKNRVDTENMLGTLGGHYQPAEDIQEAQAVVINTCGFITPAIEESVSTILEAASDIADMDPRPPLVVSGCMVDRFGAETLAAELPEVDLWLPIAREHELAALLEKNSSGSSDRVLSTGPGYAYLKITEGCSHKCSFCTIPSIRGPLATLPEQALVDQAGQIAASGIPEIILVGQDTTCYGHDQGQKNGLIRLLDRLMDVDNIQRLRLMYMYPAGLTDELLKFLAGCGHPFVPYFDIPLQHSHPEILKSMGRPFAKDPGPVLDKVRKYFPDAALRTSLITGYPGEGKKEFEHLRDFVAEQKFHHMGVFTYFPEEGTKAAGLPGQVPEEVKIERKDELMALQAEISESVMEEYVGENLDIVVDRPNPEWPGLFEGRAWFQAPDVDGITYVSGRDTMPGQMVSAEIMESKTYDLVALANEEDPK